MATIALNKNKVNGVGGLIDNIIKSSNSLDTQLSTLKNTLQGVDSSTSNLQDTIDSISSSSKSEKEKVADLKKLNSKLTEFITTTANRDNSAKNLIYKKKNDFYTKYKYLKPNCEKNAFDYITKGVQAVCEWCKEHWVEICIGLVCIVIGAVLTALTGGAFLAALAAGLKTALIAGLISGGLNIAFYMGGAILKGEKISFSDVMGSFGDGLASGFMFGGIMAGVSMTFSSAFRFAAIKGVPTGRRGGFQFWNGSNALSPDSITSRNGMLVIDGGGTLFKMDKYFHLDVDIRILNGAFLPNYLHLHVLNLRNTIPFLGIINGHIPIGLYGAVLGGTANSHKDLYFDFKNWQREVWREIFRN